MKYLSLFSGIGGFEYGLEQSNHTFENIGYSEIDKFAKSIYKRHYPNHIDLGDATEINPKELPDFDLLVGGFPCQAFSLSGHRKGFDDTRGTLFFEIARICKEKKPKYLLLENVKGLLSHDRGRTFKKILGVLSELGYDVEWQVLNSKSFGVAQNRERVYIKGYFREKCGREILSQKRDCTETSVRLKPFHFNRQVKKRVYDCNYGELCEFLRKSKKDAKITVREISEKLDVPKTEVDHWFRNDKHFAPPPSEYWDHLKQLLGLGATEYDEFIMTWEYVDGVYDMDKRAYDEDGLSPTLTTRDESLIKVNKIGTTSDSGHWGKNVYSKDGISPTLCSESLHKNGVRVKLDDDGNPDINVIDNTSPTGHWGGDVFDENGVSRSVTATNYKHPLKVKVVGNVSDTGHHGENVLDKPDLSSTLTATNYKHPVKIVEESNEVDNNIKVVDNVSPSNHWRGNVFDTDGISRCLTAGEYKDCVKIREEDDDFDVERVWGSNQKHCAITDGTYALTIIGCGSNLPRIKLKTNTEKGYDEVTSGDGVRLCHPTSTKARGRTQKGQTGALSTGSDWGTVDRDYRIRRLTPKECERLQAFPDDWTLYGADGETISDTQRYKCIGNAVTTSVITYLANSMFGADN